MKLNQETRDLTEEEMKNFKFDMDSLLEKHNCEIGVISSIQVLKRTENIKSPFIPQPENGTDTNKTEENKVD